MTNSSFFVPSNRSFGKGSTTTCCPKICKSTVNTSPEPFSKLSLKIQKKNRHTSQEFQDWKKHTGIDALTDYWRPRNRTQISHNRTIHWVSGGWRNTKWISYHIMRISYHHGFSIMSVDHWNIHKDTHTQSSNISPPPLTGKKTEPENIQRKKT